MAKQSIQLHGFTIVKLGENCITRECTRIFRDGMVTAVIQKNGNVAISHSGIFDNASKPRNQLRVVRALFFLKLIPRGLLDAAHRAAETDERDADVYSLKSEAKRLGFKVVAAPKRKKKK